MTCTWWIILSVNWSSWKNFGLILHLHADYLLLHNWGSWWNLGMSYIYRLIEKSLPVNWGSWWNFGNVMHLQIGDVIDLQIFLLRPHIWIRMHRALFCFNNEKCYDGVLFKKLAGVCSLCLVRFVQMNLHSQCSLFWCSVVGSHFSSSQCSCHCLSWWELFKITVCLHLSTRQHQQWRT